MNLLRWIWEVFVPGTEWAIFVWTVALGIQIWIGSERGWLIYHTVLLALNTYSFYMQVGGRSDSAGK